MAAKWRVRQNTMFKYIIASGAADIIVNGAGMYDLSCVVLAADGRVKPSGMSCRQWVFENLDFIEGRAGVSRSPKRVASMNGSKKEARKIAAAASKAFLESYAWRKLRMEALKLHGTRCQCCGASPRDGAVMNVDHIKPRRKFPELALELSNLQILCAECNHGKGNWDTTDWRSKAEAGA